MLHLKHISYEIGERLLLDDIDWIITPGTRLALIGPNGAGKTTLFRIITGQLPPKLGAILKPKQFTIGYLPQEEISIEQNTILDSAMLGKSHILDLAKTIESLRENVSQNNGHAKTLEKLGTLEHEYEISGGYTLEAEAKAILTGLGFSPNELQRSLHELSGGWRMRVYLARLLLMNPDLLLLDEPTNHLDLPSLEWLEQYLLQFPGSIVLISHDRYFIDRLADEIYDLRGAKLHHYAGNYHFYEQQVKKERDLLLKKAEHLQKERKHQQEFIDRFRYKNTKASQVQSRIKMLEKLEDVDIESEQQELSFHIHVDTKSYNDVLTLRDLSFRYEAQRVLENINLNVYRGQKIALVGENGAGKTTLTRLVVNQLQPQLGSVELGKRVQVGYYAQHQVDALNLDSTAFEEIESSVADSQVPQIRNIMGMFGIHGDDVFKPIRVLSGGEKARVSLVKILLSPVNFLIMDEPTNHLDMRSKEALEEALSSFDGTLILISHDRYFLDKIVHKVIEVKSKGIREFEGNYTNYLQKRMAESAVKSTSADSVEPVKKSKAQKRQQAEARQAISKERNYYKTLAAECEEKIHSLETRQAEIEALLAAPDTYKNDDLAASLTKEYHQIKYDMQEWIKSWEDAHLKLDKLLHSLSS
mgnify:CR=1 FL=1